ncbi:NAD(P)-binding domain-containing protein [Salisediminibacterium selenitireducens]|uniref:6-phosphogluconate dehydrogenase NADP-binding domain-containing protein n=1 Tax=Bacillus selenitireducens (strain ATCC 700615 / DSM 15326 / MLS10) TaxID=439292 RepID=D6Y0A6_BACIE|nr:NAD(P)-binding domain-containing protein [Salisediminibacterium selenitireducens]ADH98497.1 hypothetical protein Bsel_0976 [[Bacillus] selenitireducens MLS10]
MTGSKWGLVGIGRLGSALLKKCDAEGLPLKVYHPDSAKAKEAVDGTLHQAASLFELTGCEYVLLALPASAMETFLDELSGVEGHVSPVLINLSTKDRTDRLKKAWPAFAFTGVKLAGHAKAFEEAGGALFVSGAWDMDETLRAFFERLGTTRTGTEEEIEAFNRLVTKTAVTAAVRLERELEKEGYDADYRRLALRHMVPEIVKAYEADELGGFAEAVRREADGE